MRSTLGAALVVCLLSILPPGVHAQGSASELRLRPGDAVRLAVRDEPDLHGDFQIAASGEVLLPRIGLVEAAGRPFEEVAEEVKAAYGRVLVDEEVQVTPVLRIAVLGEVREPGLFPVDPTQSVADVLAAAGGVTPVGDPDRISLIRGGESMRLRLSMGGPLLAGRLASGDQIVVGRQSWVRDNLPVVIGAGASVLAAALTGLILR
ncbi:MAG TPA: polysaccharide biosynthesis/export family protein [Longimicrobiaceae bacterium]|nr:polysaccharide biosynthesis/export family protein [Longimicrobiaceae bacterium]